MTYSTFVFMVVQEKGLVTYFEDTWVSEKDRRRRHSIEKEIEIKESQFYKNNKPPPLFYGERLKMELFIKLMLFLGLVHPSYGSST